MSKEDSRSEEKLHRDFVIRGGCGDYVAVAMVGIHF